MTSMDHELIGLDESTIRRGRTFYILMMILSLVAFILGMESTWSCDFAKRNVVAFDDGYTIQDMCSNNANYNTSSFTKTACISFFNSPGVGFLHWQVNTIFDDKSFCLSYDANTPIRGITKSPEFDAAFTSGFVFSILANVFCAFGFFTIVMATCCPVAHSRIKWLSLYFALACICQSFSFLLFASNVCEPGFFQHYFPRVDLDTYVDEVYCSLGHGGIMAVVATCLYFICIFLAPISIAIPPYGYKNYEQSWEHDGPIRKEEPVVP